MRLEGKIAVITGAGSGIGRATAMRFAREGANVMLVDRDGDGAAETARLGSQTPGRMESFIADVTDENAPDGMMAACREAFGPLDILINNAGIGGAKSIDETDDENLDRFLDVNLRAAFRVARSAIADMPGRGGSIVHLASVFGLRGFPGSSIYSATKAALIGLTQNMAADYGLEGIRVNAIAPGFIETPLTAERIRTDPWFVDGNGRRHADGPHRQAGGDRRGGALPLIRRRLLRHRPRAGGRRRLEQHQVPPAARSGLSAGARSPKLVGAERALSH